MKTKSRFRHDRLKEMCGALAAILVQAAFAEDSLPHITPLKSTDPSPSYPTQFIANDASGEEQEFMNLRRFFSLNIPESLSPPNDPDGNWGAVTCNAQLSVRLRQETFLTNSPVIALVIYRNVGDKLRHYLHEGAAGTGYEFALTCGTNRQVWNTAEPQRENLRAGGAWPFVADLPPGSQLAFAVRLDSMFDLSHPCHCELKVSRRETAAGLGKPVIISADHARFSIVTNMTPQQLESSASFHRKLRALRREFHQHIQQAQGQAYPATSSIELRSFSSLAPSHQTAYISQFNEHRHIQEEFLIKQLISGKNEDKCAAAYLLGRLRSKASTAQLAKCIDLADDSSRQTNREWYWGRYPVVSALIEIGDPAIPWIIQNLEESDDVLVRSLSLKALTFIERDGEIQKLRLAKAIQAQPQSTKQDRLKAALHALGKQPETK